MTPLDCKNARLGLRELRRGRQSSDREQELRQHLTQCQDCSRLAEAEGRLDEVLMRLPRYVPSALLKERLASTLGVEYGGVIDVEGGSRPRGPKPAGRDGWHPIATYGGWLTAAAVASVALVMLLSMSPSRSAPLQVERLVAEGVGDHLRLLYAERPLEIASGGIHQVKPWFSGKLDFAPIVSFEGDEEFPLQGGAIALFVDRKAAAFIYKHRLHAISLFVMQAQGLPWPVQPRETIGGVQAYVESSRGFNVVLWKTGDLGYVAVSDVSAADLRQLVSRLGSSP